MKNRSVLLRSLLVVACVLLVFAFRDAPAQRIAWEHQLPAREYLHCLAVNEDGDRPILVAGIQENDYGSRDYDNHIVCFDLASGDELWRRHETEAGSLRGGKRPTSIDFDRSGNLIVGWGYFAVKEGDFEVVSKLSAKDGSGLWNWSAPSEGVRSLGTGYSHSAWVFCEGSDIVVRTARSVGTLSQSSNMQDFYSIIDASSGKPIATAAESASTPEERWRSRANSLTFTAPDGSEVTWGIHRYEHTGKNWLKWHKKEGLWMPESHWERRERVQVTRTTPHKSGSPEQFFVGREQERVLSLLYRDSELIPTAVLLVDMSEEAESRRWRVVRVSGDHRIGQQLAHGTGISHNFDGPMRLTKTGTVVIGGSMLQNQKPQNITVWK
jgi:hypothetical protein